MKLIKNILIVFILLIVLGVIFKNSIIKNTIQTGSKVVVGLPMNIEKLNISILSSLVDMKGLQIKNPAGYDSEHKVMMDMPEIYIDFQMKPLLSNKLHIDDFRLHLHDFVLIKNADGTTNIDSLTSLQNQKKPAEEKKKEDKPKEKKKAMEVQIDNLSLKIDQVTMVTIDKNGKSKVKVYNINLNEEHKNIKSLESVVSMVVFKTLTKAGLAGLMNVDMGVLGDTLSGTIGIASDIVGGVLGTAGDTTQKTLDATADATKKAVEKLKGTTDGVKDLLKNPFGKK